MFKKGLALLFALLLCVSCVFMTACGGDDETTATTPPPPTDGPSPLALMNNRDYAGRTCVIWHVKDTQAGPGTDLFVTEETASATALDRAALLRLQEIERRTGVKFQSVVSSATDSSFFNSSDVATLRTLLQNADADNIPDILMPGAYTAFTLMGEGHFLDLRDQSTLPYLDLSKDCWHQEVNRALSLGVTSQSEGYTYLATGTYSISNYKKTTCLFVDRVVLETINPDSIDLQTYPELAGYEGMDTLYEWVRGDEWTWDKLLALSKVYAGATGDPSGLKYGLTYQSTNSYPVIMSAGQKVIVSNDQTGGIPTLMLGEDSLVRVFDWLTDNVSHKNNKTILGWGDGSGAAIPTQPKFGVDHTILFAMESVSSIQKYSSLMDGNRGFDYSVLPMPMFDYVEHDMGSAQETYSGGVVGWWLHLTAIPAIAKDPVFSSFCLQTLAETGKYQFWSDSASTDKMTIWDAYITDGLLGKYAVSDDDIEMTDIVMESISIDMAGVSYFNNIKIMDEIRARYNSGNKGWSQLNDSIGTSVTNGIRNMLQSLNLI